MVCYRVLAPLVLGPSTFGAVGPNQNAPRLAFRFCNIFFYKLNPRLIYGYGFAGGNQAWDARGAGRKASHCHGCHGPGPAMENETDLVFPVAVLLPVLIVRLTLRYIYMTATCSPCFMLPPSPHHTNPPLYITVACYPLSVKK